MTLVLDCSVVMAWCFEDEASPYAESVLDALETGGALVPSIWSLEIANVLVQAERRQRIKAGEAVRFVELLSSLPIQFEESSFEQATGTVLSTAREFGLSAYDAAYLELAMRSGAELVTIDRSLANAASKAGVPRFSTRGE